MKQYEIKYNYTGSGYSEENFYKTVKANSFGEANTQFFTEIEQTALATKEVTVISITLIQE